MKKSIVLSAMFPSSTKGPNGLRAAISAIKPYDISVVEYYCENCSVAKAASLLDGYESIYLSAALQKRSGLNLSSSDADERKKAISRVIDSMLFAKQAGASAVLINSGVRPDDEKKDADCLKYLAESIYKLKWAVNGIRILLEPGDRDVEYRHLIGHTKQAISLIRDRLVSIGLVFDISHIAQLGEELYASWDMAKTYCSHVHLANCSLVKGSPLYGDKHPPFGIDGGIYSHEDAQKFYKFLESSNNNITAGIEIICREDDEAAFFEKVVAETEWFFKKT